MKVIDSPALRQRFRLSLRPLLLPSRAHWSARNISSRSGCATDSMRGPSPAQPSARFGGNSCVSRGKLRLQFHWPRSKQREACRQFHPRAGPDRARENHRNAAAQTRVPPVFRNRAVAANSARDPARSRRIESGNTCWNATIAPAPSHRRIRPSNGRCFADESLLPRCVISTPNSQCASIISSPLLNNVAESIVIFGPMFQVGCLSACSTVIAENFSSGVSRKGPPEAVRIIRRMSGRLKCERLPLDVGH